MFLHIGHHSLCLSFLVIYVTMINNSFMMKHLTNTRSPISLEDTKLVTNLTKLVQPECLLLVGVGLLGAGMNQMLSVMLGWCGQTHIVGLTLKLNNYMLTVCSTILLKKNPTAWTIHIFLPSFKALMHNVCQTDKIYRQLEGVAGLTTL